jgi:hypothetical protein
VKRDPPCCIATYDLDDGVFTWRFIPARIDKEKKARIFNRVNQALARQSAVGNTSFHDPKRKSKKK